MNEIKEFLIRHREDLIEELRIEFVKQINKRDVYKGFKRIQYDINLDKMMRRWLVDAACVLDAEERLLCLEEESIKEQMNIIIKEIL